jgi:hypothetical protein
MLTSRLWPKFSGKVPLNQAAWRPPVSGVGGRRIGGRLVAGGNDIIAAAI